MDTYVPNAPMLQGQWKDAVWPADETAEYDPSTGVARDVLEKVGHASVTFPSGFVRPFLPTSRSTDEGMGNIGDPSEVTTPREEPAAGSREGHWPGLGHSRSKWSLPSVYAAKDGRT